MRNTMPTAYAAVPTAVTRCSGHVRRNQRSRCRNPCGHLRRNVGHVPGITGHVGPEYSPDFAESQAILEAFKNQWLHRCTAPASQFELALHVDAGEASAIAAAIELGCGVLMDDKAGRRMVKNFGVSAIGTVGVLVLAKQKKLIPAVKPILEQLTLTAYFLGVDLISNALLAAGE